MSYTIQWSSQLNGDPTPPAGKATITIANQTLDSSISIPLTGKGLSGYGQYQQENFIRLLENFASSIAPTAPTIGQAWYDSANNSLKVYTGVSGWVAQGSAPFATLAQAQAGTSNALIISPATLVPTATSIADNEINSIVPGMITTAISNAATAGTSVVFATLAQAEAGTSTTTVINPSTLVATIQAISPSISFTPVQQGGGAGQGNNKVYIGYSSGNNLLLQVDSTNFSNTWPISISGLAATANALNPANSYSAANFTATNQVVAQSFVANTGTLYLNSAGTAYIQAPTSGAWGMIFKPVFNGSTAAHLWTNAAGSGIMNLNSAGLLNITGQCQAASFSTNGQITTNYSNYLKIVLETSGAVNGYLGATAANCFTVVNGADNLFALTIDQSGNGVFAGDVTGTSDERLKQNWKALPDNYLENVAGLKYGIYDRIDIDAQQAGVSAQSMQTVLPQVVHEDSEGMLSIAYGNAAMVTVIELTKRVLELEALVKALTK